MRLGAESRTKVVALALLLLLAAISVGYMFNSLSSRPTPVAAAPAPSGNTAAQPARRPPPGRGPAAAVAAPSLDPELRLKLLESSEGTKYEGTGRNIFVPILDPIPHPIANGLTKERPLPPPGPPPPPPIPLKFFGFASHSGDKRIFLAQGEDVFIAAEGEIVDRRYKVVRINATSVEIEDVLNNNRQTIPLTQS
jgi:hypothetical protein